MAIAQRQFSLAEFLELPEKEPPYEFEEGAVTRKVSPKGQHSGLQYTLCERFNRFGQPRKLFWAFPELRTTYAGRSYVPDIAVYRWERIPRTTDGKIANDFLEAPDLVVEIVSPGQSVNALVRRCQWYVTHGVQLALLVNPQDESVLRFPVGGHPQPLRGSDRIDLGELLADLNLTVEDIFRALALG
jgi:Uma2 family endonuclease